MPRDVTAILRPRTVAVLGASATKRSQGNVVIGNLIAAGFAGRVLPVHPTAAAIDSLPVVNGIDRLEPGVDTAVVAIPASGVAAALADLARAGVASAVVFTNGFSAQEEKDVRAVCDSTPMVVHGPNCMGLIDVHESMPLYPATISPRVHPGRVALLAQSGSAAIALMNSAPFGLSSVLTMGSEFQVTAPDYLRFFARDDRTEVIGVVLESIQDPQEFAAAVAEVYAAGKALAVLKVGRTPVGNLAVRAHTGARITRKEAYERFFARCQVPVVGDYDELIVTLECFLASRRLPRASRIGIVGISGGETALACDLATDLGIPPAQFAPATQQAVTAALQGATGLNPLDLGATVGHSAEQDRTAVAAILADPGVDMLMVVQDSQASLNPTMLNNYTPSFQAYGKLAGQTEKPVVIVSPTAEPIHPRVHELMAGHGVPVLRGLRASLVALRGLGVLGAARAGNGAPPPAHVPHPAAAALRGELAGLAGPVPQPLARRVLEAYGIALAADPAPAAAGGIQATIGFAAAAPFGAVLAVGLGAGAGAVELCPVTADQAGALLAATAPAAARTGGAAADLAPLAGLAAALSRLAADLGDLIAACDLAPVLLHEGTGAVQVAAAQMLAGPPEAG